MKSIGIELVKLRESGIKYLVELSEANGVEPLSIAVNLLDKVKDLDNRAELMYRGTNIFTIEFKKVIDNDQSLLEAIKILSSGYALNLDYERNHVLYVSLHPDLFNSNDTPTLIITNTLMHDTVVTKII